MALLVLRLANTNILAKERSCKRSPVVPSGPSSLKMIFALLTKVIAVYVWLTIVHLWYFSLKGLLALRWRLSRSLVWLQVGLHELSEQFIGRGRSRSGNRSGNRSEIQSQIQSGIQFGAQGRVMRQSGGGTTWMKISDWSWFPGKLIFHRVKRREVPARGTTRAGSSGSHLGRWLDWIGE